MTDTIDMPRAMAIARLNDRLRQTGIGGSIVITDALRNVTGFDASVLRHKQKPRSSQRRSRPRRNPATTTNRTRRTFMRRNNVFRSRCLASWLLRGALPAMVAVSSTMAWADQATDMCLDQRVRQAAAESIGKWAQYYPFARVLIGNDARFGYVSEAIVQQRGNDNIVCLASYHLSKASPTGSTYSVSLDHFAYRITSEADGLTVSLADLPPTLDGTGLSMEDLIARFTVNGQPYADVLRTNRERIKERGK